MITKTKTGALCTSKPTNAKDYQKPPEVEKRQGFLYKFQRKHDSDNNLISDFPDTRIMRQ